MRIVSWNILHGGGPRAEAIGQQLLAWKPDIVVLTEFKSTAPSRLVSAMLGDGGLIHQEMTTDPDQRRLNGLLVASTTPMIREPSAFRYQPNRLLVCQSAAMDILGVHVPNRGNEGQAEFYPQVPGLLRGRPPKRPGLVIGDMNSGRPGLDEESSFFKPYEGQWIDELEAAGWKDCFRHLHGDRQAFSYWDKRTGKGFRIDHAYANDTLMPRVHEVSYHPARDEDGTPLSDHAALIVDCG